MNSQWPNVLGQKQRVEENNRIRIQELKSLEPRFLPSEYLVSYKPASNSFHGLCMINTCVIGNLNVVLRDFYKDDVRLILDYLPPIQLRFMLPDYYPSNCYPLFSIFSPWFTTETIARLSSEMKNIWSRNKGKEILNLWIDFLMYDSLQFLQSNLQLVILAEEVKPCALNLINLDSDIQWCENLKRTLISCNQYTEEVRFYNTIVKCIFCSQPNYGFYCVRYKPCRHTFCKSCARTFSRFWITNNLELHVHCPKYGCFAEIPPHLVRGFVDAIYLSQFTNYK